MGPHSFKCGKSIPSILTTTSFKLFNGAALFQVRKGDNLAFIIPIAIDFNGAALFQVRKAPCRRRLSRRRLATSMGPHSFKCGKLPPLSPEFVWDATSMGPHSFKCGKLDCLDSLLASPAALQWGRTLSSAESRLWIQGYARQWSDFNGAALFQVRKAWRRMKTKGKANNPSMGPHSFKCGKAHY